MHRLDSLLNHGIAEVLSLSLSATAPAAQTNEIAFFPAANPANYPANYPDPAIA